MGRLNDLGFRVVWAQGMDSTGLLLRDHGILLLDVNRSQTVLADAIADVRARLTRPAQRP